MTGDGDGQNNGRNCHNVPWNFTGGHDQQQHNDLLAVLQPWMDFLFDNGFEEEDLVLYLLENHDAVEQNDPGNTSNIDNHGMDQHNEDQANNQNMSGNLSQSRNDGHNNSDGAVPSSGLGSNEEEAFEVDYLGLSRKWSRQEEDQDLKNYETSCYRWWDELADSSCDSDPDSPQDDITDESVGMSPAKCRWSGPEDDDEEPQPGPSWRCDQKQVETSKKQSLHHDNTDKKDGVSPAKRRRYGLKYHQSPCRFWGGHDQLQRHDGFKEEDLVVYLLENHDLVEKHDPGNISSNDNQGMNQNNVLNNQNRSGNLSQSGNDGHNNSDGAVYGTSSESGSSVEAVFDVDYPGPSRKRSREEGNQDLENSETSCYRWWDKLADSSSGITDKIADMSPAKCRRSGLKDNKEEPQPGPSWR